MSTKMIVSYFCDPCLAQGEGNEVEATATHTISVDQYRVKVDLCARHNASVMDALRVLMGRTGGRSLVCQDCGFVAASGTGLSAHQRGRHGRQAVA